MNIYVKRQLMANALAHRASPGRTMLEDGARQFRGMRLVDLARECLEDGGIKTRGMTPAELAAMALSPHRFRAAGGEHSTSDFPNLLANTASKSLRDAYQSTRRTFPIWAQQKNLPNFKSYTEIALGGAPALTKIDESGEITLGSIGEGKEAWSLLRYGRRINIGFVAIVNDDLSGFSRIPTMFGSSAARLESETVYGILNANPNMDDGIALFHASHGNYATGAGSALTNDATGVAAIGALTGKLRKATAPNGDTLNLDGRFLIVPAELETVALAMFSARVVPATTGAVNPYNSQFEVISEPRLTSAIAWFLAAAPNQVDTVHYGYLEGEDGPKIASEVDFSTDGIGIKATHNFGAKAIDYRGIAMAAGA